MSIKPKVTAPVEDPETKARREAAEERADAGRIDATQERLSEETLSVIRRFGRLSAFSGQRSLAAPYVNHVRGGAKTLPLGARGSFGAVLYHSSHRGQIQ